MTENQPTKIIIATISISILILLSGWYVLSLRYLPRTTISIVGLPFEQVTIDSMKAAVELQDNHPGRVNIEFIPPLQVADDQIVALDRFQDLEVIDESAIQESIFLQELVQRSSADTLKYMTARESDKSTTEWQRLTLFLEGNYDSLINTVETDPNSFASKYQQSYDRSEQIIIDNLVSRPDFTVTVLGDEIHNIASAPTYYTLRTSLTKKLLRSEGTLYGETSPARLFGLEFASATPQLDGYNEAYQQIDCNDRQDAYGELEGGSTTYARCTYSEAAPLDIKIVYHEGFVYPPPGTDTQLDQNLATIRRFIQANFKSVELSEWEEENYGRDITALKEEDNLAPYEVLIDEEIRNTPSYDLLVEGELIREFEEDKYSLDIQRILQI